MTHINVKISKAVATAEKDGIITAGMVGVPVSFMFDSWWDGLIVTAVFKGSGAPISVPLLDATETVVPWEVLKRPSTLLRIGAEGRLPDGTLVIPTTWATVGIIMSGANATDDLAKPPTPTAFDRIMSQIGNMNDLATEDKSSLVAAINEALALGGGEVDPEAVQKIVEDYLASNPPMITESDPTVPAWAKQPEKPSYTADEVGALSAETLPEAINTALAQAKASGEFDGADGAPGKDGADGYSPTANVTQTDNGATITITDKNGTTTATVTNGKDGADGNPGADGTSAMHSWNGTVLTITSASGTSSADLKGEKGDKGDTGPKGDTGDTGPQGERGPKGEQGIQGPAGNDGYTPVKGVDYFDGAKGDKGDTGPQGPQGETGPAGPQGVQGQQGEQGIQGEAGPAGADGQDGAPGKDGITPTIGENGNWYLGDADTGKPSRGEPGPKGDKGENGETGGTGPAGPKGDTGPKGEKGDKGDTGPQGEKGDTGATGPQGPQGETGPAGPKGDKGDNGDKGADGKSAYQYAQDGGYTGTEAEFAEKMAQEQLTGTIGTLTPTQVYDAVSAGIPVKVQYFDDTYGVLSFTAFNVAESLNMIVSQTIAYYHGAFILAELLGDKSSNEWGFTATALAQKTDIPSALPNPNALTFTGAVTGSYNGAAPMNVKIPSAVTDDHINSLIDTKLGVIENGAY